MGIVTERQQAVEEAVDVVRSILENGTDEPHMAQARQVLRQLALRTHLFPRKEFPIPGDGVDDLMTRLRQDDDGGYALYVNSGRSQQYYRPHDHGSSWAIVAAIEGVERNTIFRRVDSSDEMAANLEVVEEIDLAPGNAISLQPREIHSVQGIGEAPILHLHLYKLGYHKQAGRLEFDLEHNKVINTTDTAALDNDSFSFGV